MGLRDEDMGYVGFRVVDRTGELAKINRNREREKNMTEIEKATPVKDGMKLCNEYGTPVALDVVRLEVRKAGYELVTARELRDKVRAGVIEAVEESNRDEWDEKHRTRMAKFKLVSTAFYLTLALQTALLVAGVWIGDWRFPQMALALLGADAGLGLGAMHLWDRVPAENTRPIVRGY